MAQYEEMIRRSIKKDFAGANFKRLTRKKGNERRVLEIYDGCYYAKYRKFFIGKLVRVLSGNWVEFVYDSDRRKMNEAAGWSDVKNKYLLDGVKFE